jgi:tRNA(His) 5'-end guanylyltransferase
MKDELGDRMKSYYEDRTRTHLPRRTNVIIRIDGKAFHTYTKGLVRPFDTGLIDDMNATTKYLCENIQGAKMGYVQSDEISIVLTDYDKKSTDAWFDYNIQKMVSVSASMATSEFNRLRLLRFFKTNRDGNEYFNLDSDEMKAFILAHFDSRAFSIPPEEEVINYFIWRQNDATRNSISSVAQSLFSHKDLHGRNTNDMLDLIHAKDQNWNHFPAGQKRGRAVIKRNVDVPTTKEIYDRAKDKKSFVIDREFDTYAIRRTQWVVVDPPIFSEDKYFIKSAIQRKKEL